MSYLKSPLRVGILEFYSNKLVLHETEKETAMAPEEVISMPTITKEEQELPVNDTPVMESVEEITAEKSEDGRSESYIPTLNGDFKYDTDPHYLKSLKSFCFNHTRMILELGKDKKAVVDFNIFPLVFVEDAPITDIMVVAVSGRTIRAGISRGVSASVEIKFDEMSFIARGSWKDGKFVTQVNCLDNLYADKFKVKTTPYMPETRTRMTYMQEDIFGKFYNFFPAAVGLNADNGFAMCAAVIVENGNLSVAVSNEENVFTVIDPDGIPQQISLYWSGGAEPVLHLELEEMD